MAGATGSFVPNDVRTTLITITDYSGRVPKGTLYNQHVGEVAFYGTMELLLYIDKLLDELELPRSTTIIRSFGGESTRDRLITTGRPEAAKTSFKLKVIFRQNSSWQGSLAWVEGNSEAAFRSVFELLNLMDGVLGQSE